jgi:periplasmic protein TonB
MESIKKMSLEPVIGGIIVFLLISLIIIVLPSCKNNNNQAEGSNSEIAPPPPPPPPPVAKTDSDTPFVEVDEMPVFKGGDVAIIDFVKNNVKYPEASKLKGIQGKVIVRFAVEADRSIDKISILQGVDPDLDKEALRVVATLPAFEKPGIKDGKAVSVWYMLPIIFTLK